MDEYIDREAAIRAVLNDSTEQVGYSREDAADCIRYMDAADVAPVVHGRWMPFHSEAAGDIQYCSVCGVGFDAKMAYCPHCGAKMDIWKDEIAKITNNSDKG